MVRVLIDRRVSEGMVDDYYLAIRDMRLKAVQREGYISGESLRNVSDPHQHVIISTWNSQLDWQAWADSEARRQVMMRIGPMLEEAERITVLEPI